MTDLHIHTISSDGGMVTVPYSKIDELKKRAGKQYK